MTPQEHYQRGLEHLAQAEMDFANDRTDRVAARGTLAHSHFTAATAGAALHAFEVAAHPRLIASPPGDDVAIGGTGG